MEAKKIGTRQSGFISIVEVGLFLSILACIIVIGITDVKEQEAAFIEASESSSQKWEFLLSNVHSEGQRAFVVHLWEACKPERRPIKDTETYVVDEAKCVREKTLEILALAHASQSDPVVIQEIADRISRDFPAQH